VSLLLIVIMMWMLMKWIEFSGAYISECTVAETPDYAHNLQLAARLWMLSENIVGETFEF
jgi:hypothetical protein